MKKIIPLILASTLLLGQVSAANIYENKEERYITKGVKFQSTDTFTEAGWQRVDVVEIDLTDEDLELKVLSPEKGVSSLATVKDMAQNFNTKVAINGDFFNMISGETNMLGMVISDGELLSTPSKDNFASFALTEDGSPLFDYFKWTGTLYAENTSLVDYSYFEFYQLNKVPVTDGHITMITPAWGDSVTIPQNTYAMACEPYEENTYKMTAFSWGGEKMAIPEGGAVFIANYNVNAFLNANFAIGDIIRVEMTLTPDASKIKESIGGNTLLIKDGEIYPFTSDISGKNPRSAIGVSEDGEKLYMVAVDGRKSDCAGFTQTDLAEYMLSLGCYNAMNLDGGGSTTLVAEDRFTNGQAVINNTTSLRKVSNALGVISSLSPLNKAKGGEMNLSKDTIIIGDKVKLSYAFYDKNFNTIKAEDVAIETSCIESDIKENEITFNEAGLHEIFVVCDDVVLSSEILVLDEIFALNIYPESVDVTSADKSLTVTGYDLSGHKAVIPSHLVTFETSPSVKVSGGTVKKGNGQGYVKAIYNGLTANCAVNKDVYDNEVDIRKNDSFEGDLVRSQVITITGNVSKPENLISMWQSKAHLTRLAEAENLYAPSTLYDKWNLLPDYTTADSYKETTIEGSKVITFSASKSSSIRLTDSTVWKKLANVCTDSKESNFLFITDIPFYSLNANEKIVWDYYMDILNERGKNVFVVSPGTKSEVTTEKGVRYIYVGSVGDCMMNSYFYGLANSSTVTFSFSGNDIKYSFN